MVRRLKKCWDHFIHSTAAILVIGFSVSCYGQDWLPLAECVVRLEQTQGNAIHGGTGTVISVDGGTCYVLTCKHVVEGLPQMQVIWRDGRESTGRVVAQGQVYDTAILRAPCTPETRYIEVADQYAPQGSTVQILGYRGGSSQLIPWQSRVLGYENSQYSRIQIEPGSGRGDSGAPMLYGGRLVGIVSGAQLDARSRPINTHGPYCTPIRTLLRMVLPHGIVAKLDARRAMRANCPPGVNCPPGGT